jgi:oxygen-dependent protoporphyrinogen oxidase
VLVVGAGISGLVAAWTLARDGAAVTLAEAGPTFGGKIRTEHVDGFVIEHGPDSFITTKPAALTLARELGLGDDLVGVTDPRRVYIRHGDALVPLPDGIGLVLPTKLGPFVRSALFSWPEKARMAADLVMPRQLGPGDTSVGAFMRRRLGDAPVDRLAGPLVGGVYNTPVDDISLDAVVPQLRTAEAEHRSLALAGRAAGHTMRAAAAARPAGARSLGIFVSLRSGMDRLVLALTDALAEHGTILRPETAVDRLVPSGAGVAATIAGTDERFDRALLATPSPAAAALLEPSVPEAAAALRTIPHGSSVLVTLAYPRARVRRPLVGHGYLVPRTEGGPVSACTWSSEKWPGRAPDDAVLLRLFIRDEPAWTSGSDEQHLAAARAEAETTLEIEGQPTLTRVTRWDAVMPRYTVGHLERLAAIDEAMAEWPAVTLTGASYRGIGLPDCISAARSAGERVSP